MPKSSLGFKGAADEAVKNLRSRWVMTLSIMLFSTVVMGSGLLLTVQETSQAINLHQLQLEKGSNVLVVTTTPDNRLSSAVCESLRNLPGIKESGSRGHRVSWDDSGLIIRTVTAGYARVVWPDEGSPSAVTAGRSIAKQSHLQAGSSIAANNSEKTLTVYDVGETSLRDPRVDDEVIVLGPAIDDTMECFVEAELGTVEAATAILGSRFSPVKVSVAPLYLPNFEITPQELLQARTGLLASGITAIGAVVLIALSWMVRRSDFTLYRTLGAAPSEIGAMIALELVVLLVLPLITVSSWIAAASPSIHHNLVLASFVKANAIVLVVSLLAIPLGVIILLFRNQNSLLKEGA